jgi:hypothetical protein
MTKRPADARYCSCMGLAACRHGLLPELRGLICFAEWRKPSADGTLSFAGKSISAALIACPAIAAQAIDPALTTRLCCH